VTEGNETKSPNIETEALS